jgi:uncharacterized protein involved in exopolysaccharide biosynthesis
VTSKGAGVVRSVTADVHAQGIAVTRDAILEQRRAVLRAERIERARMLWESRWTLLRAFVFGGLISAGIAFILPKSYEAKAKLMPPDPSSSGGAAFLAALSGQGAGMLGSIAGELLGANSNGQVFVEILVSRTVADRLIEQFQLGREYGTTKIEYTREQLEHHTKITQDRKSGVITITVADRHPEQAAAIAQAYVAELDRLVSQLSTSSARRERIFLEERLKTVKADLDNAAVQFSEFASKNTAIDIPAQGKAMVEAAAVLQGQLIAAEAEASGLEKVYTVNNVRVKALQARIAELREQLQKMGGGDLRGDGRGESSLYPSIRKLPLLGVTYADLFRRTKIEETVYELLTRQYELAKVQEAKEIPSVKVLDVPVVPTVKSSPHRVLLTGIGAALAVFGAGVWVSWRRRWIQTDPSDPGRVLAEEVAETLLVSVRRLAPAGAAVQRVVAWTRPSARPDDHAPEGKHDVAGAAQASR